MRFVVRRVVALGIARGQLNIRFGHCTSCLFDNSSVKLCKHDTPLLFAPSGANHEQGLGLDRVCEAQRSNESPSGAFKRQRGLRQQMEGRCPDKRYPNKIISKLARVADVKSRMDRTFSRIENLWPRDGSCPLPLRSKRIFNKCFRIVKTQKTSRGYSAHVMGSPFTPNAVPAPVLQRR